MSAMFKAWPRVDGLIEVDGPAGPWRGSPVEADAYLAGVRAGGDAMRRSVELMTYKALIEDTRIVRKPRQ